MRRADMKGSDRFTTIYFGGGTPTSLDPQDLDEILTKVEELFPVEQAVGIYR